VATHIPTFSAHYVDPALSYWTTMIQNEVTITRYIRRNAEYLQLIQIVGMSWNTATTAINCAPIECSFSSPSSSVSSLESATSRFLGHFQSRRTPTFPMLPRKDSLQLVTTIQSECTDSSTLAPSYFFDAYFEEDIIDDTLTMTESYSPESQVTLIAGDVHYSRPLFSIPPTLRHKPRESSNVIDDKLACRVPKISQSSKHHHGCPINLCCRLASRAFANPPIIQARLAP